MTPEDYQEVERLYHTALEHPADQRQRWLEASCAARPDIRAEVESLLAANDEAGTFMESAAMTDAARQLAVDEDGQRIRGTIGAYEVIGLLGRGGMGEVYLAYDRRLGRKVAVKVLRPGLTDHPDVARRFEQEARAASSLNHPNIVTIYEIGDLDNRRYLAMEFVEGQSLASMLGRPADAAWLSRIGVQLARALSVAHRAGIVHRDIKPENIVVRADGYVKLLDFGLARLLSVAADSHTARPHRDTNPDIIIGTPGYMSPEQARGETAGTASDIFSLGVVLYQLATGIQPFEADSPLATLHAITSLETAALARKMPSLPVSLERLLLRMLAKAPAARPSADEIEAELAGSTAPPQPRTATGWTTAPEARRHNLPSQRTELLGRAAEIAALRGLLLQTEIRLLTMTGPGGTGKTRLALHVAAELADYFEGGAAFVNLAPINDPGLVASAVASALGVRETGERSLVPAIAEHLNTMGHTLLLIDNFEQVSAAAAVVRELLDACAALTVLITSRVVLHIYGEREFPVPPLALPSSEADISPAALMQVASVALFVQRAIASTPHFTLTPKNAGAIADICRRLDGLPLAIELAAARVRILPPSEIRLRIERRLELLTLGARDLPERQQTLRRTIKWSYDLLAPPEQTLFRRLSVFAGGCTLEAIEAVCNTSEDLGIDVLDGVTALVENSLLVQRAADDGEPRFTMLETFREYGREQLLASGETAPTERAHAAYMLVRAEEETLEMSPADRDVWLRGCDAEHDNFRAAFGSLIATGNVEWAQRLGGALFRFWERRNHLTEGFETLARVLEMPGGQVPTRARARALFGAAVLCDTQSHFERAVALSREARDIYNQFGDTKNKAAVSVALAWQVQRRGDLAEAMALFEETVGFWQQLGDPLGVDLARSNMATVATLDGQLALARLLLHEVATSSRARGDLRVVASALNGLGDVAVAEGNHAAARQYHHDSLAMYRQVDDHWGVAGVLADLATVDVRAEDYPAAERWARESLRAFFAVGHPRGVARQVETLAWCAAAQRLDERAVMLASAAAAIRFKVGSPPKERERAQVDKALQLARERLPADVYQEAWRQGRAMPLDQLLDPPPAR
jgi:predicted ATPase/serine/threonine protein kinase